MKKHLFLFLLFPLWSFAQQDAYLSNYQFQMSLLNPAYVGSEGQHSFALTTRNQWAQMEDSPKTIAFTYGSEKGKNVGLGISVISDQIFIEKQTQINVDFSYKLTLSDEALLYLGLKAGGNSYRSNPVDLNSYMANDPAKKALSRFNPNFGIGAFYKHKSFWLSASIPRLIESRRDDEVNLMARDRIHIYLAAGGNFPINEKLSLLPSVIYRKGKGINAVSDLSLKVAYLSQFEGGFAYRTNTIWSIQASFHLNNTFSLCYAYDTYLDNPLSGLNLKAHEIGLRIKLGNNSPEEPAETENPEE
jgi:type IX secretion system PorP/SprF family membrane protein